MQTIGIYINSYCITVLGKHPLPHKHPGQWPFTVMYSKHPNNFMHAKDYFCMDGKFLLHKAEH